MDEAVGDETPRLADKEKMPYMEAVCYVKINIFNSYRRNWNILIILCNPASIEIQLKSDDFERCRFMFQTLYELLRYISHVPALVPHATMEDISLGGYTIPKGTQVMRLASIILIQK